MQTIFEADNFFSVPFLFFLRGRLGAGFLLLLLLDIFTMVLISFSYAIPWLYVFRPQILRSTPWCS